MAKDGVPGPPHGVVPYKEGDIKVTVYSRHQVTILWRTPYKGCSPVYLPGVDVTYPAVSIRYHYLLCSSFEGSPIAEFKSPIINLR